MPRGKRVRRNERGHGAGSIKDLPGGKARAWKPPQSRPDDSGGTYRPSRLFHPPDAREQAEAWLRGLQPGPEMALGQWNEIWLSRRWARLRPATRVNYTRWFKLVEALALRPIGSLTVDDWQLHLDGQLALYARSSVQAARNIWSAALSAAVRAGHLTANPLLETVLSRPVEQIPPAWRLVEIHRLMLVAAGHQHEAWLHLGFAAGLRMGELRALEWSDVDLEHLTVTVSKALANKSDVVGPTKSGRIRVVDLPPETGELLAAIRKRQEPACTLVCGRSPGAKNRSGPYTSSAYRQWLIRLCDKAGVERHHPHAMRHSFASLAIERGVPLTAVSKALGHADVTITGKVYAHFLERQERRTAKAVGRALYEPLHSDLHTKAASTR